MLDWERNVWSLCYQVVPVTLTGDLTFHSLNVSLKTFMAGIKVHNKGVAMELKGLEKESWQILTLDN